MNNTATNDLGLIYMNARYYVGSIGRFASADTIVPDPANPQSFNRYSYVLNRPLSFIDPTGHRECNIATLDCSSPMPHTSAFQEALLEAWTYYEANFDLPFASAQNMTQRFSCNHDGVDWSGEFTVLAPASGTVTQASPDSPAGMWRIGQILRDENGNRTGIGQVREWSVFNTATDNPLHESDRLRSEDHLLEPERLLETGEWEDLQPGWSHARGTVIRIDHGHNLETIYYHTNYSVAAGTTVNQGDVLGVTANNGWSSGTHLHYTLQFTYNGNPIKLNPLAPPPAIRHLLTIP
jgi:RHS repeat-associated protein